jgi:pimeloyl-ACP methyl ester carboxylesterase
VVEGYLQQRRLPTKPIRRAEQTIKEVTVEYRLQHFIGAKGVELVADVGGKPSAPSVLLLHGGGQTRHSWGGAMRHLVAGGYHVLNLDARGHGDSQWSPDGDYTLETLAKDLELIISTLTSRPALVGASMGGAAALTLVGTDEKMIAAALILVDIVPRMDSNGASKVRDFMKSHIEGFATLENAADAVSAYNPTRPRPKDISGLMTNLRRHANGRLYWHWDPRLITGSNGVEPPLPTQQLAHAANHVRIPTLLVRGLKSEIVTEAGVADIKSRIPQIELFDVVGAGHMVAGDKNDAFNQGVFEFLHRHLPVKRW